jgi:hypothetical protein
MRKAGRQHVAGLEAVYEVRHMQYLFHFSSAFYDIVVKNYSNTQTSIPDVNLNNTFLKYCTKKEALCRYNESYKTVADVLRKGNVCYRMNSLVSFGLIPQTYRQGVTKKMSSILADRKRTSI